MLRLLIIDDHAIVREGYRRLLERRADLRIVAEAGTAEEGYAQFKAHGPDVVLLDLSLGTGSGLRLLAQMLGHEPQATVLVFSMHAEPMYAVQALRAGARGYVTKGSAPQVLVEAVYQVARGQRALSPDLAGEVAALLLEGPTAETELTPREFDVLRLLLQGLDVEAVGQALHISPKTVRNCHYQLKAKLGVRTDLELSRKAAQMQLLPDRPLAGGSPAQAGPGLI
jgi:DNA-binding NarL/FixJ family response regulator